MRWIIGILIGFVVTIALSAGTHAQEGKGHYSPDSPYYMAGQEHYRSDSPYYMVGQEHYRPNPSSEPSVEPEVSKGTKVTPERAKEAPVPNTELQISILVGEEPETPVTRIYSWIPLY